MAQQNERGVRIPRSSRLHWLSPKRSDGMTLHLSGLLMVCPTFLIMLEGLFLDSDAHACVLHCAFATFRSLDLVLVESGCYVSIAVVVHYSDPNLNA